MPGSFFDTNALLSVASADPAKADRVEELIGAGGTISVQVLNEIANVARRKMGMSWTETCAFLSMIRPLPPLQPLTIDIHETGLALARGALRTVDPGCHDSRLGAALRLRHALVRRFARWDPARRPPPHRQPFHAR
jgi:hypothetical protein